MNGKVGEPIDKKLEIILPMVNGKTIKSPKLKMTKSEFENLKLSTKNRKITEFKLKIPGKPTQTIKGNTIDLDVIKNFESIKKDMQLVIFSIKDSSDLKTEPLIIIITD